ncbi:hypothetical protein, partial [Mesorhizobium sp. M2A.F.Ca.ET.029.05.1.1]|uniref:hypothetical protein n=1 Tax=Mesorhizobium sp. M2A.F.Ca.ET.029.05.1.1 TaxID=2496658 RepID=UPI001AECA89B
ASKRDQQKWFPVLRPIALQLGNPAISKSGFRFCVRSRFNWATQRSAKVVSGFASDRTRRPGVLASSILLS